jgi:hypothetical protein
MTEFGRRKDGRPYPKKRNNRKITGLTGTKNKKTLKIRANRGKNVVEPLDFDEFFENLSDVGKKEGRLPREQKLLNAKLLKLRPDAELDNIRKGIQDGKLKVGSVTAKGKLRFIGSGEVPTLAFDKIDNEVTFATGLDDEGEKLNKSFQATSEKNIEKIEKQKKKEFDKMTLKELNKQQEEERKDLSLIKKEIKEKEKAIKLDEKTKKKIALRTETTMVEGKTIKVTPSTKRFNRNKRNT